MSSSIKVFAQNLEGKVLLILGGTGLFAKTLLPKLVHYIDFLEIKTKIYLTTRDKNKAISFIPEINKSYVEIITIDFLYEDEFTEKLQPNFIIHMATTTAIETYNQIPQFSKFLVLQNSTRAICKVIKDSDVEKILFVSSGVVYGDDSSYEENENSNINFLDNRNSLAVGKLYSEFYLNAICNEHSTELKIARCFSFISEHLPYNIHYAVGNFVWNATFNKEIVIKSDGKDLRSFQDISDTVEWLTFIFNEQIPYKIINVGSDESISILDLAKKVKQLINAKSKIIIQNNNMQIDNMRRGNYVPSLKRAYSLGLKQKVKLDESIINLSNNLKRNKC